MIVCWRTVRVPEEQRARFLAWIEENRALREERGILFEIPLERRPRQNPLKTLQPAQPPPGTEGGLIVVTAWASHDAFDAWIETPDRDRLMASDRALLGRVRPDHSLRRGGWLPEPGRSRGRL